MLKCKELYYKTFTIRIKADILCYLLTFNTSKNFPESELRLKTAISCEAPFLSLLINWKRDKYKFHNSRK